MSSLTICIGLDNDAFRGDDCGPEAARILCELVRQIKHISRSDLEGHTFVPMDANGNKVGYCDFEIDEEEEGQDPGEVRYALRFMSRAAICAALHECSIQTYDHEDEEHLKQALINSIMDDDIDLDTALSFAD